MNEQELNNRIQTAFSHAVPDVLDAVRSQCQEQKGTVLPLIKQKRKQNIWRRFSVMAAAVVLVIGLGAGIYYNAGRAVASTVSLDVNPSIEIKVNKNEKVLAVNALNEDAKIVVGTMDFEGSSLEVAVNALIGSMLRNGYLNELANSILVSVDDKDAQRGKLLEERLAGEINALLQTDTFEGSVLSQTITISDELQSLADQHGITPGKAQLIQQIVTQNPRYTFEDLVALSINELNLIIESGDRRLGRVTITGTASAKAYVHPDNAMLKALLYAKVEAIDVLHSEYELDYEDGCIVYELEFYTRNAKYDCYVDAVTGQVLKCQKEDPSYDDHYDDHHEDHHSTASTPASAASTSPVIALIGADKSKPAILAHAGVAESDIYDWECELDWKNDLRIYEIEFKAGGYEYSYEIHAHTGKILDYEKEPID